MQPMVLMIMRLKMAFRCILDRAAVKAVTFACVALLSNLAMAQQFNQADISRGAYLARVGDCIEPATRPDRNPCRLQADCRSILLSESFTRRISRLIWKLVLAFTHLMILAAPFEMALPGTADACTRRCPMRLSPILRMTTFVLFTPIS